MKKLLALGGALALASCAASAPAYAQDVRGSVRITIGDRDNYYGNNYYNPRYRNDRYYDWQYFRFARPYYYGRVCYPNEVLVVNRYNGRYYCMDKWRYNRYNNDRRHSGRNH